MSTGERFLRSGKIPFLHLQLGEERGVNVAERLFILQIGPGHFHGHGGHVVLEILEMKYSINLPQSTTRTKYLCAKREHKNNAGRGVPPLLTRGKTNNKHYYYCGNKLGSK